MIFNNLKLIDSKEILIEPFEDERGFFSRIFCISEMEKNNIISSIRQINNSFNKSKGTIRGFHYQINGFEESKILRAISGKFLNVTIDLRRKSQTYLQIQFLEVESKKRNMIYVPKGCANAIQILEDNTELIYFSSEYYSPENEKGIKYNDKFFNIDWPIECKEMSDKDKKWPDFNDNF